MFLCALNLDGEPLGPEVRARYESRIRSLAGGYATQWVEAGAFGAWVVPGRVPFRPLWARRRGRLAVGNVRLDHLEEVQRWGGTCDRGPSSLDAVLDAYDARGER